MPSGSLGVDSANSSCEVSKVLLLQDFSQALRRLRKDLGTTLASIAALACGIGAAVATWSLLSAILLKPLAVEAPER